VFVLDNNNNNNNKVSYVNVIFLVSGEDDYMFLARKIKKFSLSVISKILNDNNDSNNNNNNNNNLNISLVSVLFSNDLESKLNNFVNVDIIVLFYYYFS
jgi:hypothetical protein